MHLEMSVASTSAIITENYIDDLVKDPGAPR